MVLLEDKKLKEAERYIIDALSKEEQFLYQVAPEIVIPSTLKTLRFAMSIKDRVQDKKTLEGLLSSSNLQRLIEHLKEDSGI